MRISDWSSDVCSSNLPEPGLSLFGDEFVEPRRSAVGDERQAREGDLQTEDDLNEAPESARRLAEREGQAGHDNDNDRDDLGDRALNGFENLLQRFFPRHPRAGGLRRGGKGDRKSGV